MEKIHSMNIRITLLTCMEVVIWPYINFFQHYVLIKWPCVWCKVFSVESHPQLSDLILRPKRWRDWEDIFNVPHHWWPRRDHKAASTKRSRAVMARDERLWNDLGQSWLGGSWRDSIAEISRRDSLLIVKIAPTFVWDFCFKIFSDNQGWTSREEVQRPGETLGVMSISIMQYSTNELHKNELATPGDTP